MRSTLVIDADGHVHEPPVLGQFLEFVERPYRARVQVSPDNPMAMLIDGQPWPGTRARASNAGMLVRGKEPMADWHEQPARCGMWDPHKRIQDMDLDGVAAAVLFPGTLGLAAPGHPERPLGVALTRAYNNWLAAYCHPYPDRLKGVAALPVLDIQESVAELRRCVTELGFVGASMPNRLPNAHRNLDDPAYQPLWDEAQRLDVPICIHNNTVYQTALGERFTAYIDKKPIHDPAENMLAVQCLIFGQVLDRFPRLRFAFMEGGVGWVPFWMDRLGEYYEEFLEGKFDRGAPAEYFKSDQCFFSCEVEERTIPYVAKVIGPDRIVYASDYLHHDAIFPGAAKAISERTDLAATAKAKILGGNAIRLFGLNEAAIDSAVKGRGMQAAGRESGRR